MAETTIGWTATPSRITGQLFPGYTFNPWTGCTKVSAGCAHCYAETLSKRWGKDIWGDQPRVKTSASYWKQPLKWNKEAELTNVRRKVFCASFADVGEDRQELAHYRAELMALIEDTPMLDWLLLTKRPENLVGMFQGPRWTVSITNPLGWPLNVWVGTSVEDQAAADERIFELMKVPARIHFLSVEPMIGPVDLSEELQAIEIGMEKDGKGNRAPELGGTLDWVIIGGESGTRARRMQTAWAADLIQQCLNAGVAVYMKQMGGYPDKGEDLGAMPEELRVRQWPA